VPFIAVLKAREVIEPALAAEAAENATEDHLQELQDSIDRMKTITDHSDFIEENRTFHSIIARASGNQVMEIFWSTISILATGEHHGIRYTKGNQQQVIEAHQSILEALRARDSAAAAERMDAHVRELELLVRKRYQFLLKQATSIVARKGRRLD
jgi:DNA-binding GntR family transcriptional regulator